MKLFLDQTGERYAYRSSRCAEVCSQHQQCSHFVHSVTFGDCILCSGCDFTLGCRNDPTCKHYTSWSKQSCVENATTVGHETSYLDDPLYRLIFRGHDVYANVTLRPGRVHGWGTHRSLYKQLVAALPPNPLLVEVGVWKGATVAILASELAKRNIGGKVLAVDTWLGALEMWDRAGDDHSRDLRLEAGYPTVYRDFLSNVIRLRHQRVVIPFPTTSEIAAQFLMRYGVRAHLIHLDAGHEYAAVKADLAAWAPVVAKGGVLLGDDYVGYWRGVRQAVDEYALAHGLAVEVVRHKWILRGAGDAFNQTMIWPPLPAG